MLFYNQIKRQFTPTSWKRGQVYFRENRVKNVRLDGEVILGQVQGSDKRAYETAVYPARGTITNSKCSCPAHRLYETHCKHVAALGIWVVERGSLLRLNVGTAQHGKAERDQDLVFRSNEEAKNDPRLRIILKLHPILLERSFILRRDLRAGVVLGKDREGRDFEIPVTAVEAIAFQELTTPDAPEKLIPDLFPAEGVAFVRGLFQNKSLQAITVEPALRYIDPVSQIQQVATMNFLTKTDQAEVWKTSDGVFIKLMRDDVPIVQTVGAAKVIYQGPTMLDNLARIMTSAFRDRIVLHSSINIELSPKPLKLASLSIGQKTEKGRMLKYRFANDETGFSSDEFEALALSGKLSSQYVWKDNKLYRFETPLNMLSRYASRSGVSAAEEQQGPYRPDGISYLSDDAQYPLHPIVAYRLSLELGAETFEVDPDWVEFHEWKKTFEKTKVRPLPEAEYGFTLRDYQTNGLQWMWSLNDRGLSALLADDMGLGKTHQVLALLTSLYSGRKKPTEPTLVIAPTSVVSAWAQKLQKYDTHLRWHIFHGKSRMLPKTKVDLVLTTYGILQREAALRDKSWHIVVLDEAQAIKNASTISARASRALKAKFRIAMTGTPVENQATDLWSIMEYLLPGYLGSLPRFKRLYGSGREIPSQTQAQILKRLVSPFLLRRTKAQVLKELPEKTEEVIHCEMTATQKKAYKHILKSAEAAKMRASLEGTGKIDYANILALLTRLKQVCDHPRLIDITAGKVANLGSVEPLDSGKWEALDELVNEALGSDLKIVIFTQYLGMLDLMGHQLKARGVGYTDLRGDTPDRTARLNRFQNDPECKVFLCSLLAGGLGIDLTAASVCIHYDRWWNPAKENQATDRLHRIGQTRGVQVFKLQIPGTVEDRIASIIESKTALSGVLIEESPVGLKAFSRKQLLELLTPPDDE